MSDSDEKNNSDEQFDNEDKPDLDDMMAHMTQLAEIPEDRGDLTHVDDDEQE